MPSFHIYDEQSDEYKAKLMPESTPKIAVEAGATMGWYMYIGHNGGCDWAGSVWCFGTGPGRLWRSWALPCERC